jgi:hypothetical protein
MFFSETSAESQKIRRPRDRSSSPGGGQESVLLRVVQTCSGVHTASYQMDKGGFSSGIKGPVREAHHSLPASAEVKKTWVYISTPQYVFMA